MKSVFKKITTFGKTVPVVPYDGDAVLPNGAKGKSPVVSPSSSEVLRPFCDSQPELVPESRSFCTSELLHEKEGMAELLRLRQKCNEMSDHCARALASKSEDQERIKQLEEQLAHQAKVAKQALEEAEATKKLVSELQAQLASRESHLAPPSSKQKRRSGRGSVSFDASGPEIVSVTAEGDMDSSWRSISSARRSSRSSTSSPSDEERKTPSFGGAAEIPAFEIPDVTSPDADTNHSKEKIRSVRHRKPTGVTSLLDAEDFEAEEEGVESDPTKRVRTRQPRGARQTGHVHITFKAAGDEEAPLSPRSWSHEAATPRGSTLSAQTQSSSEASAPGRLEGSRLEPPSREALVNQLRRRDASQHSTEQTDDVSVPKKEEATTGGTTLRRKREKTHSSFVDKQDIQEAMAAEQEKVKQVSLDGTVGGEDCQTSDAEMCEKQRYRTRKHSENQDDMQLLDKEAQEIHCGALMRYSQLCRVHKVQEPTGFVLKGVGGEQQVTQADISMLAEAVPYHMMALGLAPEVLAHSFRCFQVEEGDQLFREGTVVEHVFIVGAATSIALSKGGRWFRDIGTGQTLGAESLKKDHVKWQHTAVMKRTGEVWAVEAAIFRELLAAVGPNEEQFYAKLNILEGAFAFKYVLPIQMALLAANATEIDLKKDECLFRCGEEGSTYFVLKCGAIEVLKENDLVWKYATPGLSFGELCFHQKARRRHTTAFASEPSTLVALDDELLHAVFGTGLSKFLHFTTIQQVMRGSASGENCFADLTQECLDMWAERCEVHIFGPSDDLLMHPGLCGMLLVIDGSLRSQGKDSGVETVTQSFQVVGVDHLLDPPAAWLKHLSAGPKGARVAALPAAHHKLVLQERPTLSLLIAHQRRVALVRKVFIFRHLSEKQISDLVMRMTLVRKKKGEYVVREGESGAEFFLIHEGEVAISKNNNFITKLSQPAYFGERALLYDEPRAATVVVDSGEATFCVLTKSIFLKILHGGILDFMAYRNKLLNTDLQFSDLEVQKVIGRGGYGVVKLVKHKGSGTRYALKCVTRDKLSDQDRSLVQRERAVLQLIDHPFCLKLVRSFKDVNCVYFLTELVTGGELLDALDCLDVLDKSQAQFYLGSLLVVFEYIHEKMIVYRDLKPENVLLDQDGFIKLIDFGAARKLDSPSQKCFTLLGTPHFMAAEMILGKGYGRSADIWAMGVCLYEFMVGRLPFDGDKPVHIFREVTSKKPVWIPDDLDPATVDMLRWLLQKNPADRVVPSPKGYKAFREHPFFQSPPFNFDALVNRNIKPPCTPRGEQYSADVHNEGADETSEAHEDPAVTMSSGEVDEWDKDF